MNVPSISLISAVTALLATVLGPCVSMRIARNQFKASVISTNRAKWIESMRELIAIAISQLTALSILRAKVHAWGPTVLANHPTMLNRIERGTRTNYQICLLLNPNEPSDQELIQVLDAAVECLRSQDDQAHVEGQVQAYVKEIVRISQSILKKEWLRVKRGT